MITLDPMRSRLAAAAALFLIGTAAPAGSLLGGYPLFGGQAWRCLAAALVLIGVAARRGLVMPTRREAGWLALLAAVGIGGFNASLVAAARHADPAVVGAVVGATPVILAVLAPLRARRRPHLRVVAGAVLIAAGTALASGFGAVDGAGLALCALALTCEVVFAMAAVPVLGRLGALRTTAYAFLGAVPVLVVVTLVTEGAAGLAAAPDGAALLALAYLALPVAVVANLCWYAALGRLGADGASPFYALTPVGALVGTLVLTGVGPGPRELAGIAVVTVGLVVGLLPAGSTRHLRPGGLGTVTTTRSS